MDYIPAKKLGFGLMRLPLTNSDDSRSIDMDAVKEMVDLFIKRGFTYFDTAWMYCGGKSEECAKEAIVSRYPRDAFTLATKLPSYKIKSFDDRETIFSTQLERTGAGYFDYYLLHDVNSESIGIFEEFSCFDFIRQKKEDGLIRHIGLSYHDGPELLDEILSKHSEIEFVQIQLNYLDWDSLGVQSRKCYDVITRHGKNVIVMEPVKGGTLVSIPESAEKLFKDYKSDASVASWAIRFAASQENVMVVLSGMSNMAQLDDNTTYMDNFVPLDSGEMEIISKVTEIINSGIAIPCTGCSYCTVNCPMNIAIPQYFSLYNANKQEAKFKAFTSQASYYRHLTTRFGKAGDCIKCGECEKMCPQHLEIRNHLEDVAKLFEK